MDKSCRHEWLLIDIYEDDRDNLVEDHECVKCGIVQTFHN